ncbi:MAG TPA: pilus assembly protein [Acetobacteraceae bacterium]|nr:pilus assembly protein [Acetobacteraceae bacterium]
MPVIPTPRALIGLLRADATDRRPAAGCRTPTACASRGAARQRLLCDRRAAIAVLIALSFPFLIALGVLAANVGYLYYRQLLLRQTVTAAALAGASNLTTYYSSGNNSTATVVAQAQAFATANEPTATYGTVVPAADVVLGTWSNGTFTSLAASGSTTPNSVQVTGLNTTANGNAVSILLGSLVGVPTANMTSTATASFATGQNFDTIVINDLSQSFKSEISEQQSADKSILNCVTANAAPTSLFGITAIDGHSTVMLALAQANPVLTLIESLIGGLNYCGTLGMPQCSGSNIAAGVYSAIQQFSTVSGLNATKNIIIITDGVPNADPITYTTADGIYPTPTSTTPTCTSSCTDADMLVMAQNQAADAYAAGINVSTIYYSGDTPASEQSSYAASLATLRKGVGVSLVAPTPAQITTVLGGFCSTMASALKLVN